MSVMAIEVALKKPLCINSNIVHRIDRVSKASEGDKQPQIETVMSCSQFKIEKFSSYFSTHQESLSRRLGAVSIQLTGLGIIKPVHIEIQKNKTQFHKVSANGIVISEDLLISKEFESLVMQALLLQKTQNADEASVKMIADYLVGVVPKNDYITDLWTRSANELTAYEKLQLKLSVQNHLNLLTEFKLDSSLENIVQFITAQPQNEAFKQRFYENMQNANLLGDNLKFDLLIQLQDVAEIDLKQLQIQTKSNFKKVALQTENGIYVLPYMVPLNAEAASKVVTQMRMLISSPAANNTEVKSFEKNTEHLILVNSKSSKSLRNLNYAELLTDWKKFVVHHPKVKFVKFHIPSLQYVAKKTKQNFKLNQLLSESAVQQMGLKNLGWTQVNWDQSLKAYQPVAFYDAVQFYRLN